jgi:tetratricopeptide (TPR) repeat protein
MKIKTVHSFIIFLILPIGYLTSVAAVTDEEIEALEKQIEQQEVEEKKQVEAEKIKIIEAEAKRKAEIKRKVEYEAEKKRDVEIEKQRQEEYRKNEADKKRIAELERQREKEERIRAEIEKKAQYDNHINKAEIYVENEDYNEAIQEYELLLKSFPDDVVAIKEIKNAQALLNACHDIVGEWQLSHGPKWVVHNDYTADGAWLIFSAKGEWQCLSAKKREFVVSWPDFGWIDYFELSEDSNTLNPIRSTKKTNISGSRITTTKTEEWKPSL